MHRETVGSGISLLRSKPKAEFTIPEGEAGAFHYITPSASYCT